MAIAARTRLRAVRPRGWWRYGVALAYVTFVLAPFLYMAVVALQSDSGAGSGDLLPTHPQFDNFARIWQTVDLGLYLRNSLIVATSTGAISSLLALGAAYVIARFRFPLRNVFRISLLATQTVPGIMLLLPLFVIYIIIQHSIQVRIVGTYWGLVLTYMTFALPFAIWLLSVYVKSLPVELEEQAIVDGANRFQVIRHVTLPLAIPGIVVTFVFSFLLAWNDILFASVLTSPETKTLGPGLQYYVSESFSIPYWNLLMAASLVVAVPAMILFLVVQRYIVAGLAAGSLKG
ncbi:MAG TPA: carbohydrate ABC transporter permease [Chloroflexi bacterium]|jgi:multiple sugar transport system permease protein|nr:carbohydrate ABC transporter permease [Chloroflexota bacterium]HAF20628.1 carbohydrate ABC transporter permease [Chloroflexota bacterium]